MTDSSRDPHRDPQPVRYRCTACGNLTRFDVTALRRTRAFHHYSVGGELTLEEEQVLLAEIESVECRWCGTGANVVELAADELDADGTVDVGVPGAGSTS